MTPDIFASVLREYDRKKPMREKIRLAFKRLTAGGLRPDLPGGNAALPGKVDDLCVIISWFNPMHYTVRLENLERFYRGLKSQGLKVFAFEVAFGGVRELVEGVHADEVTCFHSSSVLWHKESLYNIAARSVPRDFQYLVFSDADLLFTDTDWAKKVRASLDSHQVSQPYAYVIRLKRGEISAEATGRKHGRGEGEISHGFALAFSRIGNRVFESPVLHGEPGFCWAMRRDFAESVGWYDYAVIGSGDKMFADALTGSAKNESLQRQMTSAHFEHYRIWAGKAAASLKGRPGFVGSNILHLWHGDAARRGYVSRHKLLRDCGFDPETFLKRREDGLLEWAPEHKTEMNQLMMSYFSGRSEDAP